MNNTNLTYCGTFKRIIAFIIDISFVIIFTILSLNFIIRPVVDKVLHTQSYQEEFTQRSLESGLYVEISKIVDDKTVNEIVPINSTFDENSQSKEEYIAYLEAKLIEFYSNNDFKNGGLQYYKEYKIDSELFDENLNFNVDVTIDQKYNFYIDAVDNAINKKLIDDPIILSNSIQIILNLIYSIALSLSISMAIFYLLIPVINKKRATLGKMVFKIALVNYKNEKYASRVQVLIRFAVMFVELFTSIFTFGAVALVSFAVTLFTKHDSSLHDLAASTKLVDTRFYNESIAYSDKEGELACS